jgi:hypothetical protein
VFLRLGSPWSGARQRSHRYTHMRLLQGKSYLLASCLLALGVPVFGGPAQVVLKVQCRASANSMALRVTLQNGSSTDTAIVLGTSIGNGRIYAADSLVLDVRHGQDGPIEKYRPGGGAPAIAGRIDPWIVPCLRDPSSRSQYQSPTFSPQRAMH